MIVAQNGAFGGGIIIVGCPNMRYVLRVSSPLLPTRAEKRLLCLPDGSEGASAMLIRMRTPRMSHNAACCIMQRLHLNHPAGHLMPSVINCEALTVN